MAVEIREYRSGDNSTLRYRAWSGETSDDALIYLHGIESHSEWFTECAEKIAAMGPTVYGLDRRGSGLNPVQRGHCRSFLELIDDVTLVSQSLIDSHTKLHMAALSWGGKLAAAINMLHPDVFSTVTLISPGFFPRVMPNIGERLAIAVNAFLRPETLHPIPIEDEMFTSVPNYLGYIASDPLRLHNVTARFYLENFKLDRFLKNRRYQWTAPTQLLIAEHDEIVDNNRLREMFNSLKTDPKRVNIYDGCNHSIQFEQPGKVAADIVDWMRAATSQDDLTRAA